MSPPKFSVTLSDRRKERPDEAELAFGRVFTEHMAIVDYEVEQGWFDPRIVPYGPLTFDPAAAVLHYGQELFDGLKAFRGADGQVRVFRLDRHAKRMHDGGARLCMPAIDEALFREAVLGLVRADRDWVPTAPGTSLYIRPAMVATEPFLGVRPSKRYLFFVIASPVGGYGGQVFTPARIWIEDKYVRAAVGGLGGVKSGANYVASLLAAEEAKARGYSQVLWTDASNHRYFEEVGTMNLVVRIGDEFVTPPIGGSILSGVTRDSVIALLRGWGLAVSERPIAIDEVLAAHRNGALREVFGCGTAAVITPVGELGWRGEKLVINGGQAGEVARKLYDAVTDIQYGRAADTYGWMTTVE
jgi:branched-chain amino acid aminotransferase